MSFYFASPTLAWESEFELDITWHLISPDVPWCLTGTSHNVWHGHPMASHRDIPWCLTGTSHDVWHWHPMASHRHITWRLTLTSHGVSQAHRMTSHSIVPWCLTVVPWCLTGTSHDISQGCPMVMILGDIPCVSLAGWDWKNCFQNVVWCSEGRGRIMATLLPEGLVREVLPSTALSPPQGLWFGVAICYLFFCGHYCLTSCVWQSFDSVWKPAVIRLRLDLRGLVHLNWLFVVVLFIVDSLWRRVCTVRRKGMQFSLTLLLSCINISFF